ncbi:MAG: hypothetical protein K2K73_01905 [Ureaplasma sp.]|nr:hypothetical protein [Ureaplasma sp.]
MNNFEINRIINSLKFEIHKLFRDFYKIYENNFPTLDEYFPSEARTINFDNAKNNLIYKLKTNFVKEKLNLMNEIIYETNINGFYVFNKFYIRDTLLTQNSFPISQTLDICLKTRELEITENKHIIQEFFKCLELVNDAIFNIRNQNIFTDCVCLPLNKINKNDEFIVDFQKTSSSLFLKHADDKIEHIMKKHDLVLLSGWKNNQSKYFDSWYEDAGDKSLKILIKINKKIYDLGFINIFNDKHLINIVLNWNNLLIIFFKDLELSKILTIPESLISTKDK